MTKKTFKRIVSVIIVIAIAGAGAHFVVKKLKSHAGPIPDPHNAYVPGGVDVVHLEDHVLINVPFTTQAPTYHWEDPRQEDGCEEASILMAWLWINGKTITPEEAEKTIIEMSEFELKKYGNYHDFNAEATAQLMSDYFGYKKTEVSINPTIEDMKNVLRDGKVILIPSNGQKLANPHYKQPGPTTHMIVIKGFDDKKDVFITNDPGTRFGEGYTFDYQTVYNAMVDYPSGDHGSQEGRPKAMIAVSK